VFLIPMVLLLPAIARAAEADRGQVTVAVRDLPADVLEVVTFGANGPKTVGKQSAPGEFTFPADDFNDGKPVEFWEVLCDGVTKVAVIDPTVPLPPNCERKRRLGGAAWRIGTRLVTSFGRSSSPGTMTIYALGAVDLTRWRGVGAIVDTTATRYGDAGYTDFDSSVDAFSPGFSVGGGVDWQITERLGLDVNFIYSRPGGPSFATDGTRTAGNLAFSMDANLGFSNSRVRAGPTIPINRNLTVVPYVSVNRYTVTQDLTDALRAGVPQVQVLGGTRTNEASGTYVGIGARVDCRSWMGGWIQPFGDYHYGALGPDEGDIFGEAATAAWPTSIKGSTVRVGVKLRLTNIRANVSGTRSTRSR
jgi:hypothetical protein